MQNKKFSIVIPCLNEEQTLPLVLQKAIASLEGLRLNGEVLIVDNGSTDNSVEIAQKLGARVIKCEEKGYGNALRYGIESASGEYVIMGDADDSYDFSNIEPFVKFLKEGCDFVIGSRLKGKIEKGAMPFLHRYLGTPVLTFILNQFFRTKISDCNCGLRGIRKSVFKEMNIISSGMEFASEMIIKAGILRCEIREIPIDFYKDKRNRPPHLKAWRDGWRHLRLMLIFAPNFLFFLPGTTLFLMGLFLMLLQARGPFTLGWIHMELHFMILGLTLSILGISILQMGAIIKLFSYQHHYYLKDRFLSWFTSISLEKKIIFGGLLSIIGITMDAYVARQWILSDFGSLFMPRVAIFGLFFIFFGMSLVLFSFVEIVMWKSN
jgi:glycosyltransferase involved in cell wall biosynthesis